MRIRDWSSNLYSSDLIMDAPTRINRQAIEHAALVGDDLARFLFPPMVRPGFVNQVPGCAVDPDGIDFRHAAGIQAAGLDQFRSQYPAPRFLAQDRPGMDQEMNAARALVTVAFLALEADISKQARKQRHMDLLIGGRHRSEEHTSELQSLMRISYAAFCLEK